MEWKFGGQTLGKRLLRLSVMDARRLGDLAAGTIVLPLYGPRIQR
jgi:uncharacterized RDD family membrane protein YckC